jgi:hypothetical protein
MVDSLLQGDRGAVDEIDRFDEDIIYTELRSPGVVFPGDKATGSRQEGLGLGFSLASVLAPVKISQGADRADTHQCLII